MKNLFTSVVAVVFLTGITLAQIPECAEMKTTASGLQIGELSPGRAEQKPTATDTVEVHYTGWLLTGKKFDSSHDREKPDRFPLKSVIKGWTEALQLMSPGGKYKIVVPPELGYGEQDSGAIPPNSTLVFEVELLKVVGMPKMPPQGRPEAQKTLPCGPKYEVVQEGSGPGAEETEGVGFRYALFAPDGNLIDCSDNRNGQLLGGTKKTLPFPFLQELAGLMKKGEIVRVVVPGNTVQSLPKDTVWTIELVGVHKIPKFRALDPKKTVVTQSGLKYEILELGKGDSPKVTDSVSALYSGWLPDGTMFDSAHARGMPSEFQLNGVIKGWTEGLQLMHKGGVFLFEIPGELGYGANGSPPKIGPNQTLIFLVELFSVNGC
jgi:FKBP-type peptidyl-prolyl cis-trans isomerase